PEHRRHHPDVARGRLLLIEAGQREALVGADERRHPIRVREVLHVLDELQTEGVVEPPAARVRDVAPGRVDLPGAEVAVVLGVLGGGGGHQVHLILQETGSWAAAVSIWYLVVPRDPRFRPT